MADNRSSPAQPPVMVTDVYRSLLRGAPDLYLILTPDLRISDASDAYLAATMTSRESVVGRPLFEVFPDNPNDPHATGVSNLRASLEHVLRTRTPHEMAVQKYDIRRPESEGGGFEERYWSPRNTPVLDEAGVVAHIIHRAEDVTHRIQTESALLESERDLRMAIEASNIGTWRWNLATDAVHMSERAIQLLGAVPDPAAGKGYRDAIHPGDRERVMDAVRHAIASRTEYDAEYRCVGADGEIRWVVARGRVVDDRHGNAAYMQGVVLDITDRKQAGLVGRASLEHERAIAEAASRAKSEFLAHMSHEIRTPLNGVMGIIDLLLGTELTAQQRRYAEMSKASAEALTAVINDILDFSKIEAGKLDLCKSDFELQRLVEDVVEMLAPVGLKKGLQIGCFVHPALPSHVRGDGDRVRQILINLISNAIKFTEHGSVVVRVDGHVLSDGRVSARFSITDTGIGISHENASRLFTAFTQADASTTRMYGGTGLGLAISKQLAELMGGSIGVESEPDQGSRFWFTVALDVATDAGTTTAPPRVDPRTLRVLVIDHAPAQRAILEEQIGSWGMEAMTASSAASGINLLTEAAERASPFGVALFDRDMPEMDPAAFAEAVRASDAIKGTVLMVLLSSGELIASAELRSMGFAAQITKPVRQSQLFDAIVNAVAIAQGGTAPMNDPLLCHPTGRASLPRTRSGDVPRVLLAEDNEINQIVASELLLKAGYRCDIVSNGQDAVAAVRNQSYDLVLLDCQMPVLDGFQAARAIREMERGGRLCPSSPRLPIIALTANAMKGDRELCLAAGMDDYASKPIQAASLLRSIEQALCRATRTHRENAA